MRTRLLLLLVVLLIGTVMGQEAMQVPGTIIVGTDYNGNGYCLISQLITKAVGNGGLWLTECNYCTYADGSGMHFKTKSPFYSSQYAFDTRAAPLAPEGNGLIIMLDSPDEWDNYIAHDQILTDRLNEVFDSYTTPFRRGNLKAVPLTASAQPDLYSNATYVSYMTQYGAAFAPPLPNWAQQFMLMLQAMTNCIMHGADPAFATCAELSSAFTPQLLELKTNELDIDTQCNFIVCPHGPPTTRPKTAFIHGNPICGSDL